MTSLTLEESFERAKRSNNTSRFQIVSNYYLVSIVVIATTEKSLAYHEQGTTCIPNILPHCTLQEVFVIIPGNPSARHGERQ